MVNPDFLVWGDVLILAFVVVAAILAYRIIKPTTTKNCNERRADVMADAFDERDAEK